MKLKVCPICREEKNVEEFKIIGGEDAHDKVPGKPVTINLTQEVCLDCGKKLIKPIPRIHPKEIINFAKELFAGYHSEWPLSFIVGQLFRKDSPHSSAPIFSERLKSVLDSGLVKNADADRSAVVAVITQTLAYLLSEGYISGEMYEEEYKRCESLISKLYPKVERSLI